MEHIITIRRTGTRTAFKAGEVEKAIAYMASLARECIEFTHSLERA